MTWPWRRRARELELSEELEAHLEMAVAQRVARGESPEMAELDPLRIAVVSGDPPWEPDADVVVSYCGG